MCLGKGNKIQISSWNLLYLYHTAASVITVTEFSYLELVWWV